MPRPGRLRPPTVPTHVSAGIILVDEQGRILLEHRSDDPSIMFPGFWGITGGAAQGGESPEEAARREVLEETGLEVEEMRPFRVYQEEDASGLRYELHIFHAPLPPGEARPGEGQDLRLFSPPELPQLPLAYNHAEVLAEFLASDAYQGYQSAEAGASEGASGTDGDALALLEAELAAGKHWFLALLAAIGAWRFPSETVDGRRYDYLIDGEAFDWLLLAERLVELLDGRASEQERQTLLSSGRAPIDVEPQEFRRLIGEAKHQAYLNYLYGITVEEALQLAVEEEVHKERRCHAWAGREPVDEVAFQRIYGKGRGELVALFREERGLHQGDSLSFDDLKLFTYWLFKYRLRHCDRARVASDTRKALNQLAQLQRAARRRRAVGLP